MAEGQNEISTDRSRLDVEFIHRFIFCELWDTEGIPRDVVERSIATWLMQCILAHPDRQGLRRILLVTRDPRLYLKPGSRR